MKAPRIIAGSIADASQGACRHEVPQRASAPPQRGIELFEMANLPSKDTGSDGIIDVSTAQGPDRNTPCLSVTLEPVPRVINHDLPDRLVAAMAGRLCGRVAVNRPALLAFWDNGETWTRDEVNAFVDGLRKVS